MKACKSSTLALKLQGFFSDYLPCQRALSPHTLLSYRDSLKLLLKFVAGKKGDPSQLAVEDLTVERITAFLQSLETRRHNRVSTRNVRLSAIHSFFRYLGGECPEHLAQARRILAIPFKRTGSREIAYLDFEEIQAVFQAVEVGRRNGNRDLALLSLMFNTGARVSEIVGLQTEDLRLSAPFSVLLRGKGRKERTCPLWPETARLLQALVDQRADPAAQPAPVFLNAHGDRLTRFGIRAILNKYVTAAAQNRPSLRSKRLHPHSVRHYLPFRTMSCNGDPPRIWIGNIRSRREKHPDIARHSLVPPTGRSGRQ